jgi:hypothetical protein
VANDNEALLTLDKYLPVAELQVRIEDDYRRAMVAAPKA